MASMSFYKVDEQEMTFSDMFNEEHSQQVIKEVHSNNPNGKSLRLKNCGVRIMKELFDSLFESGIRSVNVHYDWDTIMLRPQLVSWDKLSWKNLQQVNNWNKVWRELFTPLRDATEVKLYLRCSWMSEEFLKSVLESLLSMPFLEHCQLYVEARDTNLSKILESYKNSGMFKDIQYQFEEWKPKNPF